MGGSGRSLAPNELKMLEQRAKKSLREHGRGGQHNVFISFSSDDLNEVNLLRAQAKSENSNIKFNARSLKTPFDSERADYIKRDIRERIRQCSVTVVYVSDNTANSKWVDWEIQESLAMGKSVVAVHKGNTPPKRLSKAITDNQIQFVPWNQNQLKVIKWKVREISSVPLTEPALPTDIASAIHDRFAPLGGVELDIPPREPMRDPPRFG